MKPFKYSNDDELNYQFDHSNMNQRTKRSHTLITTNNKDNNNQEQKHFLQQIKQVPLNFVKKITRIKGFDNDINQQKIVQNQQNFTNWENIKQNNFNSISNLSQKQPIPFQQKEFQKDIPSLPLLQKVQIQENIQFKKSQTLEICSTCLLPKDADHQCNDEYGFINCPYCSEPIVRNFLDDHFADCISYIEHQFSNLDKKEECVICMEDLLKDKQTLQCSHSFHKSCIDGWKVKSQECPVCRKPI